MKFIESPPKNDETVQELLPAFSKEVLQRKFLGMVSSLGLLMGACSSVDQITTHRLQPIREDLARQHGAYTFLERMTKEELEDIGIYNEKTKNIVAKQLEKVILNLNGKPVVFFNRNALEGFKVFFKVDPSLQKTPLSIDFLGSGLARLKELQKASKITFSTVQEEQEANLVINILEEFNESSEIAGLAFTEQSRTTWIKEGDIADIPGKEISVYIKQSQCSDKATIQRAIDAGYSEQSLCSQMAHLRMSSTLFHEIAHLTFMRNSHLSDDPSLARDGKNSYASSAMHYRTEEIEIGVAQAFLGLYQGVNTLASSDVSTVLANLLYEYTRKAVLKP